jgi:hypothetical protein
VRPQRLYEEQLIKRNLRCNSTGPYFINGSDDVKGREQVMRDWLRIHGEGVPKLLINVTRCVNLVRELDRFKKKQQRVGSNMVVLDEANRKGLCHAIEALEYCAANGCDYVAPRKSAVRTTWVRQVIASRQRRAQQRLANSPDFSGHSISLAPRGTR